MASTILEQILENVQSGARLPVDGSGSGIRQNTIVALERSIFEHIERGFERLLDDASRISRRSATLLSDPDTRRQLESEWNRIMDAEIGISRELPRSTSVAAPALTLATETETGHFDSPTPSLMDAVEAEMASLDSSVAPTNITAPVIADDPAADFVAPDALGVNEGSAVVEEVRDLLRSMQPQSVDSGDEILQRLQTLTREVRDLASREVVVASNSAGQQSQEQSSPPPPTEKRVEIGDIEGMIDGLLGM